MNWNSDAKQVLHQHIKKATKSPPSSDAYQDLLTDLTAHIEEESHQKQLNTIEPNVVKSILNDIGDNEFANDLEELNPSYNQISEGAVKNNPLFEKETSTPTLSIPVAFFFIYRIRYGNSLPQKNSLITENKLKHTSLLFGFILPVIVYYSLLFIPVTHYAIIGSIFLIGLMPLSPLICLICWCIVYFRFKDTILQAHQYNSKAWIRNGIIAGSLSLIAIEAPSYLRQHAITKASSHQQEISETGINRLRFLGAENELLYIAQYGNTRSSGISMRMGFSPAHWVFNHLGQRQITAQQARELYYLLTGDSFNSL